MVLLENVVIQLQLQLQVQFELEKERNLGSTLKINGSKFRAVVNVQ